MKRKGTPHPAPKPKSQISLRLEHVRELMGDATLQDFHARLVRSGWVGSYSSVRNYHFDRDAPVDYLVAVARACGVRLEYLATGTQPVSEAEHVARSAAAEGRMFGGLTDLPQRGETDHRVGLLIGSQAGWLTSEREKQTVELFGRFFAWDKWSAGDATPSVEESMAAFSEMLAGPIMRWYVPARGLEIHADRLRLYVDAMLHALDLAMPDGRDFDIPNRQEANSPDEHEA